MDQNCSDIVRIEARLGGCGGRGFPSDGRGLDHAVRRDLEVEERHGGRVVPAFLDWKPKVFFSW